MLEHFFNMAHDVEPEDHLHTDETHAHDNLCFENSQGDVVGLVYVNHPAGHDIRHTHEDAFTRGDNGGRRYKDWYFQLHKKESVCVRGTHLIRGLEGRNQEISQLPEVSQRQEVSQGQEVSQNGDIETTYLQTLDNVVLQPVQPSQPMIGGDVPPNNTGINDEISSVRYQPVSGREDLKLPVMKITHVRSFYNPYYIIIFLLNDSKSFIETDKMIFVIEDSEGNVKHSISLPNRDASFTYQQVNCKRNESYLNEEGVCANNAFAIASPPSYTISKRLYCISDVCEIGESGHLRNSRITIVAKDLSDFRLHRR